MGENATLRGASADGESPGCEFTASLAAACLSGSW